MGGGVALAAAPEGLDADALVLAGPAIAGGDALNPSTAPGRPRAAAAAAGEALDRRGLHRHPPHRQSRRPRPRRRRPPPLRRSLQPRALRPRRAHGPRRRRRPRRPPPTLTLMGAPRRGAPPGPASATSPTRIPGNARASSSTPTAGTGSSATSRPRGSGRTSATSCSPPPGREPDTISLVSPGGVLQHSGQAPAPGHPSRERHALTAPDTSATLTDEIRKTTCYMCACRCGIDVHLQRRQGAATSRATATTRSTSGVLCAKGAAGIMQHLSPARLRAPLRRTGPRGSGEFKEITWDEALGIATNWLAPLRDKHPEKLAFFTGRDQSQSFTGWWAQQYGTPNYAAHGGFCSVNMAAAGIYTLGGAFWEFGAPDWERTEAPPPLRRRRGPRLQPDQDRPRQAQGPRRPRSSRSTRSAPATAPSPTSGSASPPAPTASWSCSLIHCLMSAGKIDLALPRCASPTPPTSSTRTRARPASAASCATRDGRELVWDRDRHKAVPAGRRRSRGPRSPAPSTSARPTPSRSSSSWPTPTSTPPSRPRRSPPPAASTRRRSAASPPSSRRSPSSDAITLDRPWTDFRGDRHATMTGRPVAVPRDARHLRPLQRLPDLPRHPPAPAPARRGRDPRRLPLQAALPQARRRPPEAAPQGHPRLSRSTARTSATPAAPRTSPSTPTAARSASTRPSPGTRRSRRTA